MTFLARFHEGRVHARRVSVLCRHIQDLIPQTSRVLDVGCGDGLLPYLITQARPDVHIQGLEVSVRKTTYIDVKSFSGTVIPYGEGSFDIVMFVDVLHHTEDPMILLREAVRVARKSILIKDHTLDGFFAGPTLRLMDWIGNARYGVALPYSYWPQQRWIRAFQTLGVKIGIWKRDLRLYPCLVDWIFGRSLHFVARLDFD